jgi:hypothetical protein
MHPFVPVRRPPFDTEGTEAQRTQRKEERESQKLLPRMPLGQPY